jgi:hypothetical protein
MDVDEVSRIKKQARLKVEEQHGEKKMVSNMNLLYQKVCNNLF